MDPLAAAAAASPRAHKIVYRFEHLLAKHLWVQNKLRTVCVLCSKRFFLGGKHHCRRCGEVFCSDCTQFETAQLPGASRTRVRVCKMCLARDCQDESLLVVSTSSSDDDEAEAELLRKTEKMLLSPTPRPARPNNVKTEKALLDTRTTTNSVVSSVHSHGSGDSSPRWRRHPGGHRGI
ncbi:hypothetical protein H310_11422 [Aphanomyces invadans]|uniref:FYVE-type domain-containing protein n=1 Tax=Aphanomyces invadans TaxID=157072 RepID=A0A024TNE4_9STRA|nr:hypothetical protein H310_11422 [Aphanomyces invadans]ETV95156.1 hypothetical protein H310_11422 [Aphanomyces invadans]|eukprot:XP_008876329.1 hypothetical protein H310_11422 [Aphanomyces invadans]